MTAITKSRDMFAAVSLIALSIVSQHAQAQTPANSAQSADAADDAEPEIIVTGSRIARAGFDTDQPAVVVSSKLIEERGYSNLGEALQSQPAFAVPASNAVGSQPGEAISAGQTFVDFFGLGSQRTLTLVNGRRFVGGNTASIFGPTDAGTQVDLNAIPTKLIDRVETIAVGGAPIYGSDAIAGTVNIILKRDYQGIDLDAQYGLSERGDARDYRLRGLVGTNFAGGRGNITLSGEYNRTGGLLVTDRKITAQERFFASAIGDSPYRQSLATDRRIPSMSENGVPLVTDFILLGPNASAGYGGAQPGLTDAAGNILSFNRAGELASYNLGEETGSPTDYIGGDGFDLAGVTTLLAPTERYNANLLLNYQLADGIRLFGEGWYSHSKATVLRSQPVYNSALFSDPNDPINASGNLIIPISNPFLTAAQRSTILANIASNPFSDQNLARAQGATGYVQNYFYLSRANTDLISGLSSSTVEVYRFVGGFDGSFNVGDHDIKWEIVGNYGRSRSEGRTRELVEQNFLNALNSRKDANGNIVCAPGAVNSPIATLSSTCVPFNPFGQNNSQALRDYVTAIATPVSVNTQKVFTASMSGDIFTLPGGDVSFALGYEHREEQARFDPGAFMYGEDDTDLTVDSNGDGDPTNDRTSYGRSAPIDRVSGKFNTDEVFGELRVPIVGPDMQVPLVHSLTVNGAFRYVDNSLTGGDPTYTLGGAWQPVADLTIRGNYTRSIRAPAVTELFNPSSSIFTFANDPCDVDFIADGPAPATRAANCAAQGIPANFQSTIQDASQQGSLVGNPNLRNEKANSYTIGAILRPRFIPRLTVSVDWVSIKLRDAIIALDADQVFAACYDATDFPNDYCGRIDRAANGQVTFVRTGYANAASLDYQGIMAEVAYRAPTPFLGANSSIDFDLNYQYIGKLEQRVGLGDLTTLRGDAGYSKHKATANLTYANGGFAWSWQAQYYGKAKVDPDAAEDTYDVSTVDDIVYVNSAVSYAVNDRFTLRFIVDNVFDAGVPYPVPAGGGTVTYFEGIMGRSFKIGAGVSF